MLFNSGVFLKFFLAFLLLYWLVRNHLRARNILIVVASYVFYGWWDYRFLVLILFSSTLDYFVGLGIDRHNEPAKRKLWLAFSIVANLGILGFFKYYDFFVTSFADLLRSLNIPFKTATLGIILPVGISFYTFQAMSYTIDVYRRNVPACRTFINFLAFVSFFPQLVAGPIERASHLLPQFERARSIDQRMLKEGLWLILWGMFKKVVIADNLDPLVTMVYQHPIYSAPAVLFATIAFGFQIYCDFSGYSDIARGTARVLGFDIMVNFNLPYFAASIREFWRRWHISLSTWLRDYLYISLGGNRCGEAQTYLNLFITMLLGGLWHGAAWNFLLWGAWHGGGLILHRALTSKTNLPTGSPLPAFHDSTIQPPNESAARPSAASTLQPFNGSPLQPRNDPTFQRFGALPVHRFNGLTVQRILWWLVTMLFVFYGWLLFRAQSFDQIVAMTASLGHWSPPAWIGSYIINLAAFSVPLVLMEFWQARSQKLLAPLALPGWSRAILQGSLLLAIILFWERKEIPFIYFQF
ncbi:MAG: hypothetical protein L0Y58_18150 [Verrucomicrobia subdivision 3 bacterium]|nr:hypothetical protein [Limisphaerales bacterium]